MVFPDRERKRPFPKPVDDDTPFDPSRKRFLQIFGMTAATTVAIAADLSVGAPYIKKALGWAEKTAAQLKDGVQLPTLVPEVFCAAERTRTSYSLEALQRTVGVVLGDSIGKGYYEKDKPPQPAISFAVTAINQSATLQQQLDIKTNWDKQILAVEGSRIDDVKQQLQDKTFGKTLGQEGNVDVWLSVGGNDLVHALADKAKKLKEVGDNPFTPDFFKLDDDVTNAIHAYEAGFAQLLKDLSKKAKAGNMNRLVIEGLPNLGSAKSIQYVSRDGKVQATYDLSDGLFTRHFARNLSVMINNAMKNGVNDLLATHPSFDIIFLNNFDDLPQQDLLGEHPLPQGQQKMAQNFFNRSYYRNDNLGQLIFPPGRRQPALTNQQSAHWGDKQAIRFAWS